MNTKHDFHNPDNLTPEQVGEGYRLLLKSEVKYRDNQGDIHRWDEFEDKWNDGGWGEAETYRVPLATWPLPLPIATLAEDQVDLPPEANEIINKILSEPEWIPWHGGECPLKDDEVEEWEWKLRNQYCSGPDTRIKPSNLRWCHLNDGHDIIAYRVLKWKKSTRTLPPIETFPVAMEAVTKQESAPTDNDSWNCLLATNARLGRKVAELENKLTAAEARLKQLEWVPYSERKPTREEADDCGYVVITDGINEWQSPWAVRVKKATHWRPIALPITVDTDRVEFEKWWSEKMHDPSQRKSSLMEAMYDSWKAARAKEVVK